MMKCIITKPTLSLKSSVAPCKVITVQKLSQGNIIHLPLKYLFLFKKKRTKDSNTILSSICSTIT